MLRSFHALLTQGRRATGIYCLLLTCPVWPRMCAKPCLKKRWLMATQDSLQSSAWARGRKNTMEIADTESFLFLPQCNKRWPLYFLVFAKRGFPPPSSLLSRHQNEARWESGSTPCICTVTCSTATFDTCESQSEKEVSASCRKSGLMIPLEQEALAWHITLCVVVNALGLQEIMEFIRQLELLVRCEGSML